VCPTDPAAPIGCPQQECPTRWGLFPTSGSDTFQTLTVPGGAAHPPLEERNNGFDWVQTPQCLALRLS